METNDADQHSAPPPPPSAEKNRRPPPAAHSGSGKTIKVLPPNPVSREEFQQVVGKLSRQEHQIATLSGQVRANRETIDQHTNDIAGLRAELERQRIHTESQFNSLREAINKKEAVPPELVKKADDAYRKAVELETRVQDVDHNAVSDLEKRSRAANNEAARQYSKYCVWLRFIRLTEEEKKRGLTDSFPLANKDPPFPSFKWACKAKYNVDVKEEDLATVHWTASGHLIAKFIRIGDGTVFQKLTYRDPKRGGVGWNGVNPDLKLHCDRYLCSDDMACRDILLHIKGRDNPKQANIEARRKRGQTVLEPHRPPRVKWVGTSLGGKVIYRPGYDESVVITCESSYDALKLCDEDDHMVINAQAQNAQAKKTKKNQQRHAREAANKNKGNFRTGTGSNAVPIGENTGGGPQPSTSSASLISHGISVMNRDAAYDRRNADACVTGGMNNLTQPHTPSRKRPANDDMGGVNKNPRAARDNGGALSFRSFMESNFSNLGTAAPSGECEEVVEIDLAEDSSSLSGDEIVCLNEILTPRTKAKVDYIKKQARLATEAGQPLPLSTGFKIKKEILETAKRRARERKQLNGSGNDSGLNLSG